MIRIAAAGDKRALEHLAQLDSATTPIVPTLIGELRGRPVAALSLADGKAIANPFVATSDILELLRLRAGHLNDRRAHERRRESSVGSAKAMPEHSRRPIGAQKGSGIVAVANGLVQVTVGGQAPAVRHGEVLVADSERVEQWRNVGHGEARLFWIVLSRVSTARPHRSVV